MKHAEYTRIPFHDHCGVLVRSNIHSGDIVRVPRQNGSNHYHTIKEVASVSIEGYRYCTVVPVTRDRIQEVFHGD